jgi:hypothetical protein
MLTISFIRDSCPGLWLKFLSFNIWDGEILVIGVFSIIGVSLLTDSSSYLYPASFTILDILGSFCPTNSHASSEAPSVISGLNPSFSSPSRNHCGKLLNLAFKDDLPPLASSGNQSGNSV